MELVYDYFRLVCSVKCDQVTSMYANVSVHLALLYTLLCNVHLQNLMIKAQSRTPRNGLQISLNRCVSLSEIETLYCRRTSDFQRSFGGIFYVTMSISVSLSNTTSLEGASLAQMVCTTDATFLKWSKTSRL